MNKRFFTLMAAVMLAGSPFASEAFAADPEPALITGSTALGNNVKFIIGNGTSYFKVNTAKAKDGATYATVGNTPYSNINEASVFEVRNFVKNGLGVSFELYVDNVKFATSENGTAVTKDDAPVTAFTATGASYALKDLTAIKTANFTNSQNVYTLGASEKLYTKSKTYTQRDFEYYNAKSTTFSFNATNLEGNVFEAVQPIDLKEGALQVNDTETTPVSIINNAVPGTYFVTGDAETIAKFKAATTTKDSVDYAKKLSFVYVQNARYSINALTTGEGYKFVKVSGADFYAAANKRAKFANAAFLDIKEADQLNNEGSMQIMVKPYVTDAAGDVNQLGSAVRVVAIKPSATDTKTYVTTYATSGSQFTPIYPTLGNSTYFKASEFLKVNQVSAYNIYFTAGAASTDGSDGIYHKYLISTDDAYTLTSGGTSTSTKYAALAANAVDLNTPYAQWIVTGFDNRYKLTLENRATGASLTLRLAATSTAGVYDFSELNGGPAVYVGSNTPAGITLASGQIKLVPATLGKLDAVMTLTEDQLAEGIVLSFTGKDSQLGAPTYYAKQTKNNTNGIYSLIPSTTEYSRLAVKAYEDTDEDYIVETEAIALNASGQQVQVVDTLVVPTYELAYAYSATSTKYANSNLVYNQAEADAAKFAFAKTINGKYVLVADEANEDDGAIDAAYLVSNKSFYKTALASRPADNDFAYVSVDAYDNYDYSSLDPVSRHATLENSLGAVSMQLNANGIVEGILAAEPMTFWLDTADSDSNNPSFYISKGIPAEDEEETKAADEADARLFLYMPVDSAAYFDEPSATWKTNAAYYVDAVNGNIKAIFRPAALVAEDTLATLRGDKEVLVVKKDADAAKGEVTGLEKFQYRIVLADDDTEDEFVVKSKHNGFYLYSLNGKLGFTNEPKQAMRFTIGAGDPTANEAIAAESGVQVIGGQGVVTVQGAAGKVVTVANILGQTIANQVAASDNVTIAAPAGIVVVSVDGEATKVIVK